MNKGKLVAGILGGLAVGVAVGILFAPDKGIETRRKIMRRGKEYMDDMKDCIEHKCKKQDDEDDSIPEE